MPQKSVTLLLFLFFSTFCQALEARGFKVMGTDLLDATGQPFVMRGVNIPHAWFPEKTEAVLEQAAAKGCNTVRLVFANGVRWEATPRSQIRSLLDKCNALGLVAVVEIHDTTGFPEATEAAPLFTAVDYWIDYKDELIGREAYVVLNIGNEPIGNNVGGLVWFMEHAKAIRRLREAGFLHTLMVDAANWGQDWSRTSLEQAPRLLQVDPLRNTVFSVHMYEVYQDSAAIEEYFRTFQENELCLVVGEFADSHKGKPVAADAILRLASEMNIGYLGWSWSGNNEETEPLDLVLEWDPNQLSSWGEFLFNSEFGIRNTAKPVAFPDTEARPSFPGR